MQHYHIKTKHPNLVMKRVWYKVMFASGFVDRHWHRHTRARVLTVLQRPEQPYKMNEASQYIESAIYETVKPLNLDANHIEDDIQPKDNGSNRCVK